METSNAVRPLLGIPDNMDVLEAVVPFGYPAQAAGAGKKQRKPLGEIASRERFGQPFASATLPGRRTARHRACGVRRYTIPMCARTGACGREVSQEARDLLRRSARRAWQAG